jgi:hypothetical protein
MVPFIACLPPEILDRIFSFIYINAEYGSAASSGTCDRLGWLSIAHVCRQWREIALNQPRFWSHIDFTALTLAGATEMLARVKEAPLHLEADLTNRNFRWKHTRFDAFRTQVEAHVSHIRSLSIIADPLDLLRTLQRLMSPAPALESLSLSSRDKLGKNVGIFSRIPPALFDHKVPRLIRLELDHCNISWSSSLLKGLRHLKLLYLTEGDRPSLQSWLDAMNELSQLESLIIHSATPIAPQSITTDFEPVRVVTLPSLTQLHISALANDCALALAHLVLPALTWLRVEVRSSHRGGGDVRTVLPHFARNAYGPQDKTPLQSMVISGYATRTDILLWTVPDADVEYRDNDSFTRATFSARAAFTASNPLWDFMTEATVYDAAMAALPTSSLTTLTVLDFTVVTRRLWLRYTPRWPLLQRVRLGCTVIRPFIDALTEDAPSQGPLLPSLVKLVTTGSPLTMDTALRLRDMLLARVERGVPIQTLDLCECAVLDDAMRLFRDLAADTRGPTRTGLPKRRVVWPAPLVEWEADTRQADWSDEDDDDAQSHGTSII